jgi:hypothetical protein
MSALQIAGRASPRRSPKVSKLTSSIEKLNPKSIHLSAADLQFISLNEQLDVRSNANTQNDANLQAGEERPNFLSRISKGITKMASKVKCFLIGGCGNDKGDKKKGDEKKGDKKKGDEKKGDKKKGDKKKGDEKKGDEKKGDEKKGDKKKGDKKKGDKKKGDEKKGDKKKGEKKKSDDTKKGAAKGTEEAASPGAQAGDQPSIATSDSDSSSNASSGTAENQSPPSQSSSSSSETSSSLDTGDQPAGQTDAVDCLKQAVVAELPVFGDRFVQIGSYRLGDVEGTHFSVYYKPTLTTVEAYRSDSNVLSGPSKDMQFEGRASFPLDVFQTCIRQQDPNAVRLEGGEAWIQIGEWRIGMFDADNFSFSHKSRHTSLILRSDGTALPGEGYRTEMGLWDLPVTFKYDLEYCALNQWPGVKFEKSYIEFTKGGQKCRLGEADAEHLALTFAADRGHTSYIWRADGTVHPGPRDKIPALPSDREVSNGFLKADQLSPFRFQSSNGIRFGDRFIQIGSFVVADIDGNHLSIWNINSKETVEVYRGDSTEFRGPRTDYQSIGRPDHAIDEFSANPAGKCKLL